MHRGGVDKAKSEQSNTGVDLWECSILVDTSTC